MLALFAAGLMISIPAMAQSWHGLSWHVLSWNYARQTNPIADEIVRMAASLRIRDSGIRYTGVANYRGRSALGFSLTAGLNENPNGRLTASVGGGIMEFLPGLRGNISLGW